MAAPIKVFVIAGQSNAAGGGLLVDLPASLNISQNNLYQYRQELSGGVVESTNWEALRPRPMPGAGYGIELTFGLAMEQRLGEPVAVIKVAANGSGLWNRWLPEEDDLYPWMTEKVNSALGQLESLGYQADLSGFLWIQGENDAGFQQFSEVYDDNLATLASAVRTDLNAPNLPFVLNQAHVDLARPHTALLRTSQQNAADLDPNMFMINADDLQLTFDSTHFTAPMFFELGRRFADVLAPSGDFNDDGLVNAADLPQWQASFGGNRVGDGNADGVSDGADFLLWQRQFGYNPSQSIAAIPVPEPSAAAFMCLLLAVSGRGFPRRHREF